MSKLKQELEAMRRRRAQRQADKAAQEQARRQAWVDETRERLVRELGADVVEALEEAAPFEWAEVRNTPALRIRVGTEVWRLYWSIGTLCLMSANSKVDRPVGGKPGTQAYADEVLEGIEWILARQARRASKQRKGNVE